MSVNAYLGKEYSDFQVKEDIKHFKKIIKEKNCTTRYYEKNNDVLMFTAKQLSLGKIIGWFQGKMEWGPRALEIDQY